MAPPTKIPEQAIREGIVNYLNFKDVKLGQRSITILDRVILDEVRREQLPTVLVAQPVLVSEQSLTADTTVFTVEGDIILAVGRGVKPVEALDQLDELRRVVAYELQASKGLACEQWGVYSHAFHLSEGPEYESALGFAKQYAIRVTGYYESNKPEAL